MNGGYEEIYESSDCVWGLEPGSLIVRLESLCPNLFPHHVLDAGCGEGKNSAYYAAKGASVTAIDISSKAIDHAKSIWGERSNIEWHVGDINELEDFASVFELVIAYGLYHCLGSEEQIKKLARKLKHRTRSGGVHIVCSFNNRHQELAAHVGFKPTLLEHATFEHIYDDWKCLYNSDSNLTESHPHNNIVHTHSISRFLFQKR